MSGRLPRAGMHGLLILCLLGAPLISASAAVGVDAPGSEATVAQTSDWHPLSFVYSLLQQLFGTDPDLENGAQKTSSSTDTDFGSTAEGEGAPEIPAICYGPGIDPHEC